MTGMRFIHTADWHLGRLFHGVHLTDDQAFVLDGLIALIDDRRPDAVVIAGDVYDRALPPTEAVALLDETLRRIVDDLAVPVLMVAGNHDSPTRLGFAASLLRERGLHVAGPPAEQPLQVVLHDDHGPVVFALLPFAEPAMARAVYGDPALHDQAAAVAAGVERAREQVPSGTRGVLVTHCFAAGSLQSESERPLTVGGSGAVPPQVFAAFDYVALGHLHRPQAVHTDTGPRLDDTKAPAPRAAYAGSLLKYSFDEAAHEKSVAVVDIGAPGSAADGLAELSVERVPLSPRRDVRRLNGTLADILERTPQDPRRDDYIEAVLQDRGAIYDVMGRLRDAYPNALSVVLAALVLANEHPRAAPDPARATDTELLTAFFEHVTDAPPSSDELEAFAEVADGLAADERETDLPLPRPTEAP